MTQNAEQNKLPPTEELEGNMPVVAMRRNLSQTTRRRNQSGLTAAHGAKYNTTGVSSQRLPFQGDVVVPVKLVTSPSFDMLLSSARLRNYARCSIV